MNRAALDAGCDAVRARWPGIRVRAALVLGSGWSDVAEALEPREIIGYGDIPGLGEPGVPGHAGRLLFAEPSGLPTLIFQGRRHAYEGVGWEPVALPVFVAKSLGAESICLTNAAGGIRQDLRAGDLMLLEDHVHRMSGSPLQGAHDPFWGARFPDQTRVYDPALAGDMEAAGHETGLCLARGIYLGTDGPAYETPAEVRAARALGADAVGMSTTPEAMLAHAAGLRVCGLSCITNLAAGLSPALLSHDDVTAAARAAMTGMRRLLAAFWKRLARPGGRS